jgi:hypothetical protein
MIGHEDTALKVDHQRAQAIALPRTNPAPGRRDNSPDGSRLLHYPDMKISFFPDMIPRSGH